MKIFIGILLVVGLSQTLWASSSSSGGAVGAGGAASGAVQGSASANVPSVIKSAQRARDELRLRLKKASEKPKAFTAVPFDLQFLETDQFLKSFVQIDEMGVSSSVKYSQIDPSQLKSIISFYLSVPEGQYLSWVAADRLAFMANLYNLLTIDKVLTGYPKVKSIKDLGSGFPFYSSVWSLKFFRLFDQSHSLDDIEHGFVRGTDLKDSRIHFAFVCASKGCPKLANEAYVGSKLEQQLNQGLKDFLRDRSRNRVSVQDKKVYLSKIFSWYQSDFAPSENEFKEYLLKQGEYLADNDEQRELLKSFNFKIDYLDYDWNLNSL